MNKLILLLLYVTLSFGQDVTISGIVKDKAGVGIPGAMVKLKLAGYQTSTSPGGSFTLTKNSTNSRQHSDKPYSSSSLVNETNAKLIGSQLNLRLAKPTEVLVEVFTIQGARLSVLKRFLSEGTTQSSCPKRQVLTYIEYP